MPTNHPSSLGPCGEVCSSPLHSSQLLAPSGNANLIPQTDVPKHEQQIFHASNPPQGDQQSRWGSWTQHQPWGEQAVRSCETQMLLLIITPLYWGAVLDTISTRAFPYMDRAGWSWSLFSFSRWECHVLGMALPWTAFRDAELRALLHINSHAGLGKMF